MTDGSLTVAVQSRSPSLAEICRRPFEPLRRSTSAVTTSLGWADGEACAVPLAGEA